MKWRKIFFRRVLRFRRRHTYLALGGIVLSGFLFGAMLYQAYYQLAPSLALPSPPIQEESATSASPQTSIQPSNARQNISTPPPQPPAPTAVHKPTATTPVPQVATQLNNYPSGSENQPIKQSDKVTTTCKGSPRSLCRVQAVHAGNGEVIHFAHRTTDETGIATWVWSPSADGLTQGGTWNISAAIGQQTSNSSAVYVAGQVNAL